MVELLTKIAERLSKDYNIPKDDVLKILQFYFFPFERKPKDTFLDQL